MIKWLARKPVVLLFLIVAPVFVLAIILNYLNYSEQTVEILLLVGIILAIALDALFLRKAGSAAAASLKK